MHNSIALLNMASGHLATAGDYLGKAVTTNQERARLRSRACHFMDRALAFIELSAKERRFEGESAPENYGDRISGVIRFYMVLCDHLRFNGSEERHVRAMLDAVQPIVLTYVDADTRVLYKSALDKTD